MGIFDKLNPLTPINEALTVPVKNVGEPIKTESLPQSGQGAADAAAKEARAAADAAAKEARATPETARQEAIKRGKPE
jgi:hypothetical protein